MPPSIRTGCLRGCLEHTDNTQPQDTDTRVRAKIGKIDTRKRICRNSTPDSPKIHMFFFANFAIISIQPRRARQTKDIHAEVFLGSTTPRTTSLLTIKVAYEPSQGLVSGRGSVRLLEPPHLGTKLNAVAEFGHNPQRDGVNLYGVVCLLCCRKAGVS